MSLDSNLQSAFTAVGTAVKGKISSSEKGAANGVATLDGTGKLTASQMPTYTVGGLAYQGVWDANTNSPVIPAATTINKGWYYKVSVAGATTVDTINDWKIGDWIVSNGATWDKVDNTDSVSSVAGRTGAVVLTKSDVGLANVDNTSDAAKPVSTAQQTALDLKANLASPTFTGTVSGITKSMVGLGSVDNTSDAAKPVSTATQIALNAKADASTLSTLSTNIGATDTNFVTVFNAALV
jgi:hypothetical protein